MYHLLSLGGSISLLWFRSGAVFSLAYLTKIPHVFTGVPNLSCGVRRRWDKGGT